MTEPEVNNVITLNGKEYDSSKMNEQQTYWIAQIQDLQMKRQSVQFQLDQVSVALDSFVNVLIQSLSDNSETKDESETINKTEKYDA
jgi:hypothetical protein|tara:strand:+ start:420 stop:680 length:261 start_codon:yes stop_codon:yes gene_type:complete